MSERAVFGSNLRRYREARGWSQADLGKRVGHKDGMTISHYECGRREPTLRMLSKLARGLEVDAGKLISGVPSHDRRIRPCGRRIEDRAPRAASEER